MALSNPKSNRIKITGEDFGGIRARILSAPDEITSDVADQLDQVGKDSVDRIQERILNAITKTGQLMKARGYRSTSGRLRGDSEPSLKSRPRTGPGGKSMYDSVDYKVSVNKRSISLRFGWLQGKPGYAFFQEHGTSNGVPAMHALTDAKVQAEIELNEILRKVKWR